MALVSVAAAVTEERSQLRAGLKTQGTFWGQKRIGWSSAPADQQDRDQKPALPGNWECSGSSQALGTKPQQLSGSSPAPVCGLNMTSFHSSWWRAAPTKTCLISLYCSFGHLVVILTPDSLRHMHVC